MPALFQETGEWSHLVGSKLIDPLEALMEGQWMLWGALALASLALFTLYHWSRKALRRWQAAQLHTMASGQIVSPDCIPRKTAAFIEIPTPSGIKRVTGTIQAIQPRGTVIAIPSSRFEEAFAPGTPLIVLATVRFAAYRFHASVVECRVNNGAWMVYLTRPQWVERVQRRNYVRVPVKLPTIVSLMRPSSEGDTLIRGMIYNLSGGGAGVATPVALPQGTLIRVRVPLPMMGEAGFDARVTRCSPLEGDDSFHYLVQCEFL
ncbi:MAG TPA: PilZ domain-containing protein, partial [Chthonomonadales bacterium]|nr:PilZ domain-containing protein [Chthonomonadales bacterium]